MCNYGLKNLLKSGHVGLFTCKTRFLCLIIAVFKHPTVKLLMHLSSLCSFYSPCTCYIIVVITLCFLCLSRYPWPGVMVLVVLSTPSWSRQMVALPGSGSDGGFFLLKGPSPLSTVALCTLRTGSGSLLVRLLSFFPWLCIIWNSSHRCIFKEHTQLRGNLICIYQHLNESEIKKKKNTKYIHELSTNTGMGCLLTDSLVYASRVKLPASLL